MMNGNKLFFGIVVLMLLVGCHRQTSKVCLQFTFSVDGESLQQDSMRYCNAAGNRYEVNEIQFFVSDMSLVDYAGNSHLITTDSGIHYVDIDIPSTLQWNLSDELPVGQYKAIRFVLGLSQERNQSGLFVNPPENNMSWPGMLGGGYHHIKINGHWLSPEQNVKAFNLHLGNGQTYDGNQQVVGLIDNAVVVEIPIQKALSANELSKWTLDMNINQWFENPNLFDWNVIGGSIMQNQTAQDLLKANGKTVFSIK